MASEGSDGQLSDSAVTLRHYYFSTSTACLTEANLGFWLTHFELSFMHQASITPTEKGAHFYFCQFLRGK